MNTSRVDGVKPLRNRGTPRPYPPMKSTKSSQDKVITPQVMSKAVITGMTNRASCSCSSTIAQRNCPNGLSPIITNQMYVPKYCQYENSATTQQKSPIVNDVNMRLDLFHTFGCQMSSFSAAGSLLL